MSFLQGFFTCALLEGVIYTVIWIVRRYAQTAQKQCPHCEAHVDDFGVAEFPVGDLWVCTACGDTIPSRYVGRHEGARSCTAVPIHEWAKIAAGRAEFPNRPPS